MNSSSRRPERCRGELARLHLLVDNLAQISPVCRRRSPILTAFAPSLCDHASPHARGLRHCRPLASYHVLRPTPHILPPRTAFSSSSNCLHDTRQVGDAIGITGAELARQHNEELARQEQDVQIEFWKHLAKERGFESMYPHFRPDLQVGRLAKGQPVELHPIIDHIEFYCMCSAKNSVGYAELKGYEEYMGFNGNAYEDPAINDLVTSPPCSRMIVRMQGDLAADINNPQGVTVYDVVEGVARYYERPVSDEAAKYWWRKWGGPRYEDEVVTVDDYLPQHCERPNWDRGPEVQEDGSVLLECLRIYGHNEQHR